MSDKLTHILALDDFEREARKHLPECIFGYIAGASETNASLDQNRAAFQHWAFLPRFLNDVSTVSTKTGLWGENYAFPFGIAPLGLAALWAYRGDKQLACAAQGSNIPMIMSGSSLIRLEEVARLGSNIWFQAYLPGSREEIVKLVERVARAGFHKLVITVDTPIAANRENNVRAGFSTPLRPTPRLFLDGITHPNWLFGTFCRTIARHGLPHFENNYADTRTPILSRDVLRDYSDRAHLTWDHFRLIRDMWKGKLIIKGILSHLDARKACGLGADGIIVSNHGGRQLDGSVSPLRVLAGIVQECGDVPVMMDSGVRRGTDALKALALGARLVFAGRPFAYAASIGGEAGVKHAISLLGSEIARDMALLGATNIDSLDTKWLVPARASRIP